MKNIVFITALVLGLSAIGATAKEAAAGGKGKHAAGKHERVPPYIRYDKDGDGVLSKEEWPYSAELFTKLDKNADGAIDADERPEKRGKLGKGGAGKGKGGPGDGGAGKGKGGRGKGGRGKR
jgi:hypothetical protein